MHIPPLFRRRLLREGRLKSDVASLDGLGVGPGDLPRRGRIRPGAGRAIRPEVVGGRGRQADGLRRPAARRLTQVTVGYGATRQAQPISRCPRPRTGRFRPKKLLSPASVHEQEDRNAHLSHVYTQRRDWLESKAERETRRMSKRDALVEANLRAPPLTRSAP